MDIYFPLFINVFSSSGMTVKEKVRVRWRVGIINFQINEINLKNEH